jgi:RHS repeat-associated protein
LLEHSDGSFQRFAWTPGGALAQAQEADRTLQITRDSGGRLLGEASSAHALESACDVLGHRVALESSLGFSLRVERDALGGAMQVEGRLAERTIKITFERDALGRETRRQLPGGLRLDFDRDGLGRVTRHAVLHEGRELTTRAYSYAGLARVSRVADSARGISDRAHDARGRLVRAGALVRGLDPIGRVFRTAERDDHTYQGVLLTESYGSELTYDGAGRRVARKNAMGEVTRYTWDTLGRLSVVELGEGDRVAYDYDALGRMVRRRRERRMEVAGVGEPVWEATAETELVWDGLAILHEIEGSKVTCWIREAGRLVAKLSTEGAWAVLTDPVGLPTELTDAEGGVAWRGAVDMFGALGLDVEHTRCPWRLPGHWEDLQHAWLRVYDPEVGAYLSPNPFGIVAGSNLYEYLPDPLSETSPLGLGRGYATFGGELRPESLEAELVERFVAVLDRGDGVAGPRCRFDADAARLRRPDPQRILWGPWERYRPERNVPDPSTVYPRLPGYLGLSGEERG